MDMLHYREEPIMLGILRKLITMGISITKDMLMGISNNNNNILNLIMGMEHLEGMEEQEVQDMEVPEEQADMVEQVEQVVLAAHPEATANTPITKLRTKNTIHLCPTKTNKYDDLLSLISIP